MAETIPSQISFSKLMSHTFPGVFATIGIFMILYVIFSNLIKEAFSIKNIFENWILFIGAFGGLIFFGTILGVIIDSIHHIIEKIVINKSKWASKRDKEIKDKQNYVFKDSQGNNVTWFYYVGLLPIDKLNYIDENYYCYAECLSNLSISFFFSAITYSIFFYIVGYRIIAFFVLICLIILSIFCFYAGLNFLFNLKLNRVDLVKGANEHLIPKIEHKTTLEIDNEKLSGID